MPSAQRSTHEDPYRREAFSLPRMLEMCFIRGSGAQAKESGTCELVLVSSLFPAHSTGKGFLVGVIKRHAETNSRSIYL